MKKKFVPQAILFDAGGVLLDIKPRQVGLAETAREIDAFLSGIGISFPGVDRIEYDLRAASTAYSHWKHAQSRRARPREITHQEFWGDFVAADWPQSAQEAVLSIAEKLSAKFESAICHRNPIPGAQDLLQECQFKGILTGCVSNSLSGEVTRSLFTTFKMDRCLHVQVYSNEVGIRKPNPGIFNYALDKLEVDRLEVWYVGDKLDRDILAARRAGLAYAILMPSSDHTPPPQVFAEPDLVIHDLGELQRHLFDFEGDLALSNKLS